jgi:hypothetical protein
MGSSQLADAKDPRAAINRRVVIISMEALPPAVADDESAGSVQQVKGALYAKRGNDSKTLQVGSRVYEGDVLSTPAAATALVKMDDGASLLLRSDTDVQVSRLRMKGESSRFAQVFQLIAGGFRYVTGALGKSRPDAVAFSTATATVGLRGTDFDVVYADAKEAKDSGTYVRVNSGAVSLGGLDGSRVQLAKDEEAFAGKPQPLTRGMKPTPAAKRLATPSGVFKTDDFDELLEPK